MSQRSTSRELSAKAAVEGIRSSMTNAELMEKFKITASGFADLLKQLFQRKLISEEDLERRGIRFRVLKPPASAPAPPPQPSMPIHPPPPRETDEEFLDTVTLTELLTFKPPSSSLSSSEPTEIPSPEEPEETKQSGPQEEKKGKFSLTGLFKKAR